jgi:hypothetical protein
MDAGLPIAPPTTVGAVEDVGAFADAASSDAAGLPDSSADASTGATSGCVSENVSKPSAPAFVPILLMCGPLFGPSHGGLMADVDGDCVDALLVFGRCTLRPEAFAVATVDLRGFDPPVATLALVAETGPERTRSACRAVGNARWACTLPNHATRFMLAPDARHIPRWWSAPSR